MTHVTRHWGPGGLETALTAGEAEPVTLTLFVSGASDSSAQAILDVRKICDKHLLGRHQLRIVDLNQEPAMSGQHHVLATPTLIKNHPLPTRMLVGDMSDHTRVLVALGVAATAGPAREDGELVGDQLGP
jgi:circadian clock protein KaiB